MLSYRHAFHAGNHADVLKHLVEMLILEYLINKEGKSLRYIDTHAGPGMYALSEHFASKNREFDSGIARIWGRTDLPRPLQRYVDMVRSFNVWLANYYIILVRRQLQRGFWAPLIGYNCLSYIRMKSLR